MNEVIAIIPARSGSKGIKNKNIAEVSGFPLIAYSICAASLCKDIDRIIVSTDSEKYAETARKYGAEVPFLRPTEISKGDSLDIEYLEYTLRRLGELEQNVPDIIVLLRPTTPLRDVSQISKALEMMRSRPDASAVVSVSKVEECAYKWAVIGENGYLQTPFPNMCFDDVNLPRQSFPQLYLPDGYVDVLRSKEILEHHNAYGNRSVPFHIEDGAIDIDNINDLDRVRNEAKLENNEIFKELLRVKNGGKSDA